MPVDEWVMFVYSKLEGVGIVTFMVLEGLVELEVLVVHVMVPEYAVYAALLMDGITLPGMVLMVLSCGIEDVAIGAMSLVVTPAAPQSVLANA
jgi:hypothetical protein